MRNTILFILGLLFAIWFLCTSWIWVYLAAVFYSYPAGILSLIFWVIIRTDKKKRNIAIPIILSGGLIISVTVLCYLLINYLL